MNGLRVLARFLYANLLPAELFTRDIDRATAMRLFRLYARLVEIENHSFCNRVCSFCPNAYLDRRSVTTLMEEGLFRKIIGDLAAADYDQTLVWARYHEPLAHESIFERVAFARKSLPKAFLSLTSNGDYLDQGKLRRLEAIGLNHMYISLYLPEGARRDAESAGAALAKLARRATLTVGKQVSPFCWRMESTTLEMLVAVPDYWSHPGISARGGLVAEAAKRAARRTSVCFSPLHHLPIDYNGKAMLCCQVRSDAPQHATSVIGDLNRDDYSLFDFYRDLAPARAELFTGGPKAGVCAFCNQNATGPWKLGRARWLASALGRVPGIPWGFRMAQQRHRRNRRYELDR